MVMLRNASDAWVDESRPSFTGDKSRRLYVKAAGANQRFAYIFFARPFPMGATILSAKLRLYNGSQFEGTATLSVNTISEKWSRNRVNWNSKPAVYATTRTQTKTDAAPGTEWEIDVTPVMQNVADGGKWFGFRITTNDGAGEWFYSSEGKEKYRPTLEVTWSDAPDAPEDLSPAGGRAVSTDKPVLRFDFTDVGGDTELAAIQVQIAPTAGELGSATDWDSGALPASEPELDLTTTSYPGLANNATAFWRVKVQDGAGIWSDWSDPESFKRVDKGVLTLNNPPATVAPATWSSIEDPTPPIFWSFTGTQVAYQIIIARADRKGDWLWTSGKVTSGLQDVTVPAKIIKRKDITYNARVRVWDNVSREKEGDRPIYSQASVDFRLDGNTAVDPVSNLTAKPATPWPWVELEWDRAIGAPDRYAIWRGDSPDDLDVVEIVDSDDVFVSGMHYKYVDRFAPGRGIKYWQVVPIVNKKASKTNNTVSATPRSASRWLMELDGSNAIMLVNPAVDGAKQDGSFLHRTVNGEPVMVAQALGGFEGDVSGLLANEVVPGLSAKEMKDRYQQMARAAGEPLIFINVDEAMEGFMMFPNIKSIARPDGTTEYFVQFRFVQTGLRD